MPRKSSKLFTALGLASIMAIASLFVVPNSKEAYAQQRCGWRATYIPDEFRTSSRPERSARFDRACNEHDRCYQEPGADKNQCDRGFLDKLEEECDRVFNSSDNRANRALAECNNAAEDSYQAISRSRESDRAYRQAQGEGRSRLESQVSSLYRDMLGRNPSLRALNDYVDALDRGWSLQRIREDIANSREAERVIERIYEQVLDRDPDSGGIRTYQRALARGWSLERIREDIADSPEAERAIERIYREVLGRNADRDGIRTYKKALARGQSLREVRRDIENSDEARRRRQR